MTSRLATLLPLVLAFLVSPAHAGGQGPARPRFTIESARQSRAGCTLVALAANGSLEVDDAGARHTLNRLIEVRQAGRKLPALLTKNFVSLTNGDCLPLDEKAAAKFADTRLQVWPRPPFAGADAKALSLFAPHLVLLFWSAPDGVDHPERFFAQLHEESR